MVPLVLTRTVSPPASFSLSENAAPSSDRQSCSAVSIYDGTITDGSVAVSGKAYAAAPAAPYISSNFLLFAAHQRGAFSYFFMDSLLIDESVNG